MFANDRDLLALEPTLLRDVGFAAQTLARATAGIASGVLTAAGVNFASLGVAAGSVLSVDGVPMEVLARTSGTTLNVSLLRAAPADAQIIPGNVTGAAMVVSTFRPQIALAHEQVLRMAGLGSAQAGSAQAGSAQAGSAQAGSPEPVGESAVVNPESLRLLECLGALHLIFAAASACGAARDGDAGWATGRAEMYRQRFVHERGRCRVRLDLDGDGFADAERRLVWSQVRRG